jgi:hypothetical protein
MEAGAVVVPADRDQKLRLQVCTRVITNLVLSSDDLADWSSCCTATWQFGMHRACGLGVCWSETLAPSCSGHDLRWSRYTWWILPAWQSTDWAAVGTFFLAGHDRIARGQTFFLFLALFAKDSLKYASDGKISKNGPFSWRHSRWRQDITAWRLGHWRHDLAAVAVTWQGAWRHGSWRHACTF